MRFKQEQLKDIWRIQMDLKKDARGYFARVAAKEEMDKHGLYFEIVHINHSFNKKKGTLRGMHYQKKPYEEVKIIQCLKGSIYDVVIDMRPGKKTYGSFFSTILTEKKNEALYLPKGFAHGFQTLEDNTLIQYFMSTPYMPDYAAGIHWNDPGLAIPWPLKKLIISERDEQLPFFDKTKMV